jgi:hypothetical protein
MLIDRLAGPVPAPVFGRFALSFGLSGVIAFTYAFFAVQYVVLSAVYPRLLLEADLEAAVARELPMMRRASPVFYLLAALIPLAAALGLIAMGGEQGALARALLVSFIALGMAGFGLALAANHLFSSTFHVLVKYARRAGSRD